MMCRHPGFICIAEKIKTEQTARLLVFNWSRWADSNRRPADYEFVGEVFQG